MTPCIALLVWWLPIILHGQVQWAGPFFEKKDCVHMQEYAETNRRIDFGGIGVERSLWGGSVGKCLKLSSCARP